MTVYGTHRRRTPAGKRVITKGDDGSLFLSAMRRRASAGGEGFPWTVPVVAQLESLEFRKPVTFFVGENGKPIVGYAPADGDYDVVALCEGFPDEGAKAEIEVSYMAPRKPLID